MTSSPSAISCSTTGSLPLILITDTNASAVNSTAKKRLSQSPLPTTVRLTSTESEKKTPVEKCQETGRLIIEEDTRPVQLLSNFYNKINEGIKSLSVKQPEQARRIFTQALQTIENQEECQYRFARAFGTVNLASTFRRRDNNPFASNALIQTFAVYLQKEELYVDDRSKWKVLNLFRNSFSCLSKLFTVSSVFQPNIKKNLAECQIEIARLNTIGFG
jgi:hypothetical protein